MKDLPGPSDMLEELGDKVIWQMDRLAATSFNTAFDEMIDFHQFLLDAYMTKDDTGKIVSFAQIGDWSALHQDWIRQYRRLFERAVEHIGRENKFVKRLASIPLLLMPAIGQQAAPEVTNGLLDLVNILIHRLEEWVARQRVYEPLSVEGKGSASRLSGPDKQAYEEVVMEFVGAWERTLQATSHIYAWRRAEIEPQERWRRYAESWPLLQRHLRNTAYLLAVAVWNEDEIGASHYCGMLLRWFTGLRHEFATGYNRANDLLTPDLLDADWADAQVSLAAMAREPARGQHNPASVFSTIVQGALADVIVIVAGDMLAWFIEGRQSSNIAPRIASRLLADDVEDDDEHRERRDTGFRSLMLNLARIHVAGERFENHGYGQWLDDLVGLLDSMTERRVVPGRVYTPSTRSEREDLMMPWLACLLASLPQEGDENAVQAMSKLTEREEAFAKGDRTLRGLLHELDRAKATLAPENQDYLRRGALALRPDAQIEGGIERLASIFGGAISEIEEQRRRRLESRPVGAAILNNIRNLVERAITSGTGGTDIFQGFTITREMADFPVRECTFRQIEKGYLTDPLMAQEPVNLWEVVTERVQDFASRKVWDDFRQRSRRVIETRDETSYLTALTEEANQLLQIGQQPILLVRGWNDPPWISEWFRWGGEPPEGLRVRRKEDIYSGLYVGTVNDIDVYRTQMEANQSLLFRADLLETVRYGADGEGRVVDISFVEGEDEQAGALVFRFTQETDWKEDEVVVLQYANGVPEGDGG